MAKRKGLKFRKDQFEALREDRKVHEDLIARARKIANEAGGEEMGYIVRENRARDRRSGASVLAVGYAANHNRKYQALIRALGAGR